MIITYKAWLLGGALLLAGCNAVLGIEEPVEWRSVATGGAAGTGGSNAITGRPTTSGTSSSTSGGTGGDGGAGGGAGSTASPLVWAQWPMPNPATAGLPNAQSYDATSIAGVVRDLITDLQWQQAVDDTSYDLAGASRYCQALTIADGSWRLPTRIELMSIVDYTMTTRLIDVNAFPTGPAGAFWTASPFAGDPDMAWTVNFQFSTDIADVSDVGLTHRVRCVR